MVSYEVDLLWCAKEQPSEPESESESKPDFHFTSRTLLDNKASSW